jgi:hypothetical protein
MMKENATKMLQNTNHAHAFVWIKTLDINEQRCENGDSINVFRQKWRWLQYYDGL